MSPAQPGNFEVDRCIFQSLTQAYSEKRNLNAPYRSKIFDLPITSLNALPLSYRRLIAWELGSCDKHPAYYILLLVIFTRLKTTSYSFHNFGIIYLFIYLYLLNLTKLASQRVDLST